MTSVRNFADTNNQPSEDTMETNEFDRVIWRPELQKLMGVTSETIRRWLKAKRLPAPDVAMSRKTLGWRISTLRASGVNLAI